MRYLIAVLLLAGCGYPPISERPDAPKPKAAVEWPIKPETHERVQKVKAPPKLAPMPPPAPLSTDPLCDVLPDDKEGVMARLECIERNLWR